MQGAVRPPAHIDFIVVVLDAYAARRRLITSNFIIGLVDISGPLRDYGAFTPHPNPSFEKTRLNTGVRPVLAQVLTNFLCDTKRDSGLFVGRGTPSVSLKDLPCEANSATSIPYPSIL